MAIMRHSDPRLTMRVYTDERQIEVTAKVAIQPRSRQKAGPAGRCDGDSSSGANPETVIDTPRMARQNDISPGAEYICCLSNAAQ